MRLSLQHLSQTPQVGLDFGKNISLVCDPRHVIGGSEFRGIELDASCREKVDQCGACMVVSFFHPPTSGSSLRGRFEMALCSRIVVVDTGVSPEERAVTESFAFKTKYFYDTENLEQFREEYDQMGIHEKALENRPLLAAVVALLVVIILLI